MVAGAVTGPSRPSPARSDCPRKPQRAARGKSRSIQGMLHRSCTGFPQDRRCALRTKKNYSELPFCAKNSLRLTLFGRRTRKFINSKRIVAQEQLIFLHENETRHHASTAHGVGASTRRLVIGAIKVHQ